MKNILIVFCVIVLFSCKKEDEKIIDTIWVTIESDMPVQGKLVAREQNKQQTIIIRFDSVSNCTKMVQVEHRETYELYLNSNDPTFTANIVAVKNNKVLNIDLYSQGFYSIEKGF